MVSNAAHRSSRMRKEMRPESAAMRRSLVIFNEGCFCAVAGSETGLELFVKAVIGEIGVKLGSNIFF